MSYMPLTVFTDDLKRRKVDWWQSLWIVPSMAADELPGKLHNAEFLLPLYQYKSHRKLH